MIINNIKKEDRIGILGAGVEGLALYEFLTENGFLNVAVYDERVIEKENCVCGDVDFKKAFFNSDVVFRSPGIHPNKLRDFKGKITTTTQFFFENCPCPIIGVTGTKGKGTTSSLIYEILKKDGKDVYLGGNIGISPLEFLDKLSADSVVVLEMSSFQLQDLSISPYISVVLMTTSDHLDYHSDVDEYHSAKENILRFQKESDKAVVNVDYDSSERFLGVGDGEKFFVSSKKVVSKGVFLKKSFLDRCVYAVMDEDDEVGPQMVERIYFTDGENNVFIGETDKIALMGKHNVENVMGAVGACMIFGAKVESIRDVIYSFSGLPHRLEFVAEKNGIRFFNDSFSTTPETSVAGVNAFSSPVVLIAGGYDKKADFSTWAREIAKNRFLRGVVLMGDTAEDMREKLFSVGFLNVVLVGGMDEGVREAVRLGSASGASADGGNVDKFNVLLSPGAASFGLFKNYKERGKIFIDIVNKL